MTDIQRYDTRFIVKNPNSGRKWVLEEDHLKAMESKTLRYLKLVDKYGELLGRNASKRSTIEAQAKEIERIDRIFRKKIKNRDMRHESIVFRLEQKIARLKREKAGLETAVIAKGMGL